MDGRTYGTTPNRRKAKTLVVLQGVENNGYEDSDYGVSLASSYSNNQQDNRFETIESNF